MASLVNTPPCFNRQPQKNRHKKNLSTLSLCIILSACGGGGSEADASNGANNGNTQATPQPTQSVEASPDTSPNSTPNPNPSTTPDSSPSTTPEPSPSSEASALIRPELRAEQSDGDLVLHWTESNATRYRVLIWNSDGELSTSTTSSLSLTLSPEQRADGSVAIVEAYNSAGDSLFSETVNVGAL
ncbi:hypothetical protein [Agaribacterium sp. ZY112]|uniref:hypothetical protein n=1 Tax=Agaribacterium sp. ZY112 TaxID=3233574 RepID=UPI003525D70A